MNSGLVRNDMLAGPRRAARCALVGVLLSVGACSSGEEPALSIFSSTVAEVVFEVDYQAGAEPFDGEGWGLFEANVEGLLADASQDVGLSRTIEQVQDTGLDGDADFTVDELVELSELHRDETSGEALKAFHILFLNGFFSEDDQRQSGVLGVSLIGTEIVVIFKPVILRSPIPGFTEQSTLIHEFGHSIGLVNAGLEMVAPHHDTEHGAHCTNRDCVMYYLNEGLSDLVGFLRRYRMTSNPVLFGQECIDDAHAASRREQ